MKYQKFPKFLLKSIIILLAFAMVLGTFAQSAKAQYQAGEWLPFGEVTQSALPEMNLLSADAEAIEVQALTPGITVSETELFGESYLSFDFEKYDQTQEVGAPNLPVLNQMIEVPLGAEVRLEILASETQTIRLADYGLNSLVVPVQPAQPKCGDPISGGEPVEAFYSGGIYPNSLVEITDDFIMRGHRMVQVQVRPVRFDGINGELETSTSIRFKLHLSGSDMERTISEADRLNAEPFNKILEPMVLNYNQGRPVAIPNDVDRVLIITADEFDATVSGLVSFKQSQGYTVSKVKLSEIGGNNTTSIKNYIKTQYQSSTPPTYIILVGDYMVSAPTTGLTNWVFKNSSSTYRTDLHYFTMDSDNEYVPDILYGRFPVKSAQELQNMISNLTWYDGIAGDEDFVKKAEFLGSDDTRFWNVAEGTHNYVIDNYLVSRGYTGIFPNNPQAGGDKIYAHTHKATGADAINSMNDNRSFVIYSGHGWYDLWDAPRMTQANIRNLTGTIIPYVASHACVTAYYALQESFGDTWVIQPGKGALVHIGASESTYWPDDEAMEKAIFDHMYADPTDEEHPTISSMMHAGLIAVQNTGSGRTNYYWEAYQFFGDPSLAIVKGPKHPGFRLSANPEEIKVCNNGTAEVVVNVRSVNEFTDPVAISASGMSGFEASFTPATVNPPGSSDLTLTGAGTATLGKQTVEIKGVSGELIETTDLVLDVFPPIPVGPNLTEPADKANNVAQRPTFRWTASTNVESYTLQIAKDEAFSDMVYEKESLTSTMHNVLTNLDTDKVFYWRVKAINVCGEEMSTSVYSFRTAPGPGDCPEGTVAQREYFTDFENGTEGWTLYPDPVNNNEWALSTARAYSPMNSVLASVPAMPGDQRMDTLFFTVPSSQYPVAVLFMQCWTYDSVSECNDGGVFEYSEDNGRTWKAVPRQHLILTPYNGTINSGVYNPLAGRQAWCGSQDWVRTVVDMKAFAGKTVAFRFRLATSKDGAAEGWYVDDFSLQTCVAKPVEEMPYEISLPLIMIKP